MPKHQGRKKKLYTIVGRALSEWSKIEETLCSLFAMATIERVTDKIGAPASAFWAIVSFEAKVKMTDAAIQFRVSDDNALMEEWTPLKNNLIKKARKRAELAHGVVTIWTFTNPNTKMKETETFFVPSLYKYLNTVTDSSLRVRVMITDTSDTRPGGRLYKKDVKQRAEGFTHSRDRLRRFHGNLYRELERREKDLAAFRARHGVLHSANTPTQ